MNKLRTLADRQDNYQRTLDTGTVNNDPSMTQQHHTDDCDINVMMARFGVTDGAIPPAAPDPRYFGDFSSLPDFRQAMDAIHDAKERFADLPVKLRNRFANDPTQLWAFVNDPENIEESIRLGLLERAPTPPKEPEAPPAAAAAPPAVIPPPAPQK